MSAPLSSKENESMFRRFSRSTSSEAFPKRPMRGLKWGTVALLLALVAIGTSSAALAASRTSASVDTRPLLKVVPRNVGIPGDGINCKGILSNGTSVCHVTLTERVSSSKPLHWFTRSDFPAMFSPSNGDLTPGQSVQVTITTKFCGGYTNLYFVGAKNGPTVTFAFGWVVL